VRFSLNNDLKRLAALAYHRVEWSEETVKAFHRLRKIAGNNPDFPLLEKTYEWILVPFTLWAIDFHALCQVIQERIEAGKPIEIDIRLLVDSLPPLPDEKAQIAAAQHEHAVQHGNYESLIHSQHKFDAMELQLARNPAFQNDWQAIKAQFDTAKFQDYKQIIRRRMVSERSMRGDMAFRWNTKAGRFQTVFDVFCQQWNLYGMMGDKPLLLKLTANLTPFGTMIFIPAYWSFDPKRDLNWHAITTMHNARGVRKQGQKLATGRDERRKEAEKLRHLDSEAIRRGLKGEKKHAFLCAGLGWVPETSPKRISRLRTEFGKPAK
jgi:hypothetical protein